MLTNLELARLLCDSGRCHHEAVQMLRTGLAAPITGVARATLLTSLGWYINMTTWDVDEPLVLAQRALAATDGLGTNDALLAKAMATSLIAAFPAPIPPKPKKSLRPPCCY
jgi:hypothetical protein